MAFGQTKDWERLYRDAARLIETMPPLDSAPLPAKDQEWLARVYALIDDVRTGTDYLKFAEKVSEVQFVKHMLGFDHAAANEIRAMLYRAFAVAERNAPASMAGSFIASGAAFDVFAALAKVFKTATKGVLLIDAYMDETALTDFATAVPEGVTLRLLADQADHKATLQPAAQRWQQQYGAKRPVQLRLATPKSLHDRAIFIDGKEVWLVSQSLNAIVKRSPATIMRAESEIASAKLAAYEAAWKASQVVI